MLESQKLEAPPRLRALWALFVTGGLDSSRLTALLNDRDEHVRAWSIQLLCESLPPPEARNRLAALARSDPSPLVRLYLASALQRLLLERGWAIAEGLWSRAEDAADANLPLMDWYGIEPAVPSDSSRALQLARVTKIPLVRRFIARRLVDALVARGESADLGP